jgi:hypothetical protein
VSYAFAGGLQARVYQRLIEDAALSALLGGAIYDAPLEPALGAASPDYVTIGGRRCGRTARRRAGARSTTSP